MSGQYDLVIAATRPTEADLAFAEEIILSGIPANGTASCNGLVDQVAARLMGIPLSMPHGEIVGVTEEELRRARGRATGMAALNELQWTGRILPTGGAFGVRTRDDLHVKSTAGQEFYLETIYRYPLADEFMLPPWSSVPNAGRGQVERLPATAGDKVQRVVLEAIECYRRGLYFASATLLGVASEAAWESLALRVLGLGDDERLRKLVEDDQSRAAQMAARVGELLKHRRTYSAPKVDALLVKESFYRELRNHAVHEPEATFEESRFGRADVGVLVQSTIEYLRELYGIAA